MRSARPGFGAGVLCILESRFSEIHLWSIIARAPIVLAVLAGLVTADLASAQPLSLSLRAGSAGPGVEVASRLGLRTELVVSGYYWTAETDKALQRGGLFYDESRRVASGILGVGVSFSIIDGVSAIVGLRTLVSRGSLEVEPSSDATLAGTVIAAGDLGAAKFTARLPERASPFMGIRLQRAIAGSVAGVAGLEVVHSGSPRFEGESSGRLGPTTSWAPYLEEQFALARWYPVLSVGLLLRFDAPNH